MARVDGEYHQQLDDAADRALDRAKELWPDGVRATYVRHRARSAPAGLLELAHQHEARMVVLGSSSAGVFGHVALSLGGGSGWVVVSYDRPSASLHNWWSWDHMHQVSGGEPVLVLDVYEHAYAIDYGAATKAYIDAFMANVRWEEVNRRVEAARGRKTA